MRAPETYNNTVWNLFLREFESYVRQPEPDDNVSYILRNPMPTLLRPRPFINAGLGIPIASRATLIHDNLSGEDVYDLLESIDVLSPDVDYTFIRLTKTGSFPSSGIQFLLFADLTNERGILANVIDYESLINPANLIHLFHNSAEKIPVLPNVGVWMPQRDTQPSALVEKAKAMLPVGHRSYIDDLGNITRQILSKYSVTYFEAGYDDVKTLSA